MKQEYAIVIGRFQPFHLAHQQLLDKAFETAERVIVILGSHQAALTSKNPWSSGDRVKMIEKCLSEEQSQRLTFVTIRDYLYNDNAWVSEIQQKVKIITDGSKSVVLVGHLKDDSSYYLSMFPQWDFLEVTPRLQLSATDIRHKLFATDDISSVIYSVPDPVWKFLYQWLDTPDFSRLRSEYDYLIAYKSRWAVAPYPVTFVTTDAVVIKSGHVLVGIRGGNPGKGLCALPGGFLNQHESILDGCLRELREETKIRVKDHDLKKHLVSSHVFDHPDRSLRGRTITHAHFFDLGTGELPSVKGSDDIETAFWMPIGDVYSNESTFFEDHRDIIMYFLGQR
jgi:bifunctional NMN adenylyltransferase/nudix hydrolase